MLKKRLDKSADVNPQIYFFILQIVMAGIVFIAFVAYVFGIANNTLLEKNYFSRDLALLIDTMYSAPGNVDYTYEGDLAKYKFVTSFSPYKVSVYEKEEEKRAAISYPFMEDKAMKFEYKDVSFGENEKLRFAKEANTIKAGNQPASNAQQLACPEINTKDDKRTVVIDPGHLTEESDRGEVFNNINEAQKMFEIAKKVKDLAPSRKLDIELTRRDAEKPIEQRLELIKGKNPAVVISLRANNEEKLTIKSYFNSNAEEETQKKSRKLACSITNSLIKNLNDFEINAVKTISKEPAKEDVLIEDKVSIMLEIGNIKNKEFFEKTDAIANAITAGIGDYYEK